MKTKAIKSFRVPFTLKADSDQTGAFTAVFATLNVIDRDQDVTVKGAFQDGQEVRITQWGHNWGALPVGKGVIHADETQAWVDGQFFMDTEYGLETYKTVKALGTLQEWSYGFDVTKWSVGDFEGQQVRFLEGLNVFEVSPVMLGAGIDTRTERIKTAAKRGARNSAADMDMMGQVMTHLAEAQSLMEQIMGDQADQENSDADGENADGKASTGKRPAGKPKKDTLAQRVADELLKWEAIIGESL